MTAQKISRNWKIYFIVPQTVGAGSSGWAGVGVAVVPIFIKLNWYKSWLEKNVDRLLLINWGQLHNGVAIYSGVLFSSVLLFLIFEFANSSSTDKINMQNCSWSIRGEGREHPPFSLLLLLSLNRIVTAATFQSGAGTCSLWCLCRDRADEQPSSLVAVLQETERDVVRCAVHCTLRHCTAYYFRYNTAMCTVHLVLRAAGHGTGRGSGRNMSWIWSNAGQVNSLLNTRDWGEMVCTGVYSSRWSAGWDILQENLRY